MIQAPLQPKPATSKICNHPRALPIGISISTRKSTITKQEPPEVPFPDTRQPHAPSLPKLSIRELRPGDDATAFRTLNEEWISLYFVLEPKDREQLEHPEILLNRGAHIYIAQSSSAQSSPAQTSPAQTREDIGCVALIPMGNGVYELSKMAVASHARGLGIGRALLTHAIAQARTLGAHSLFLGSNTRLENAVRLYESAGFTHIHPDNLPKLAYTRANVFMELPLR